MHYTGKMPDFEQGEQEKYQYRHWSDIVDLSRLPEDMRLAMTQILDLRMKLPDVQTTIKRIREKFDNPNYAEGAFIGDKIIVTVGNEGATAYRELWYALDDKNVQILSGPLAAPEFFINRSAFSSLLYWGKDGNIYDFLMNEVVEHEIAAHAKNPKLYDLNKEMAACEIIIDAMRSILKEEGNIEFLFKVIEPYYPAFREADIAEKERILGEVEARKQDIYYQIEYPAVETENILRIFLNREQRGYFHTPPVNKKDQDIDYVQSFPAPGELSPPILTVDQKTREKMQQLYLEWKAKYGHEAAATQAVQDFVVGAQLGDGKVDGEELYYIQRLTKGLNMKIVVYNAPGTTEDHIQFSNIFLPVKFSDDTVGKNEPLR